MYNEMSFLFNTNLSNVDNLDTIYNSIGSERELTDNNGVKYNIVNVFMDKNYIGTEKIKNFIKEKIYDTNNNDENPYLRLIREFSSPEMKAMRLKPGDFAYLKKLGVYPINRLMILRRYPEGCIVPRNLARWKNPPLPISTVIGWVDEGSEELFSISFSEKWTTYTEMLHITLGEILKNEFGIGGTNVMSVPGWSQGLLFGFLKEMGLTNNYGLNRIPQGDPNVLQEAAIREGGGPDTKFTLESKLKVKFETEYEQKFIGDIDPGLAMHDIINNLVKMGTSDVKYVFNGSSPIITDLLKATNSNSLDAWWNFTKEVIDAFLKAIQNIAKSFENILTNTNQVSNTSANTSQDGLNKASQTANFQKNIIDSANNDGALSTIVEGGLQTILASTVAKYRWPLKGAIAVGTGMATTPWHLTIGNPYSPVLSINNIVVKDVNLSAANDFSFNDIPKELKVTIEIELGRNLGGQEISQMFNNNYYRTYKKVPPAKSQINTNNDNFKPGINNTNLPE